MCAGFTEKCIMCRMAVSVINLNYLLIIIMSIKDILVVLLSRNNWIIEYDRKSLEMKTIADVRNKV